MSFHPFTICDTGGFLATLVALLMFLSCMSGVRSLFRPGIRKHWLENNGYLKRLYIMNLALGLGTVREVWKLLATVSTSSTLSSFLMQDAINSSGVQSAIGNLITIRRSDWIWIRPVNVNLVSKVGYLRGGSKFFDLDFLCLFTEVQNFVISLFSSVLLLNKVIAR